ncbi:glycosyltransferase family 2 protein [Caulobacter vibrioides]|uniref:Glycosyl transferase family protein n=2 Tax=Caulobacter vibrioides TaxID=155892 RepID=Q9A618_CAUVC|nr:glycosyltransferase family 2 protein [Caulobacter vibrioides]YP_002517733.1 holdfast glycosyl transferase family 2 protein HfsL [Caulobacter vibrioides NA1000]AAK24248.1 glycosyl transferase family protein [Caulobacter vibrioides CB15]ACL95825.1 holdfast glycosyl transferase family 2 protein HfsL [Caulobacter vibrioides NA1000]ATC29140.1 glycosyltransferase family 2 protein [Caulobacter vibrioides]QXZ50652.1 glycosyltransferase [Caulobacter vibrioides]
MARVTVMIPTQRRPDGLAVAARSVFGQVGVDFAELELVIVDNDQVPSAKPVADALRKGAPCPVIYVNEKRPGVAFARNAGMARASGDFIAFLDDDEEAPSGWLAALLAAQERYDADVVFGPVKARAPAHIDQHRDYLERFFSRIGPAQAGVIDYHYGCGDSLIRRSALPDPVAPFAVERNFIGGEDDLLFGHMGAAGKRFAWEPAAWVWEDPVPSRLNLGYTIQRAFAYGQGPSAHCAAAEPRDNLGVARWMLIGVGQAAVFGLVAAVKWAVRAKDRAEWLDRAARGLGKTFWWGPFKIQFYGRTA